jgi:hypothetical protein
MLFFGQTADLLAQNRGWTADPAQPPFDVR